VFAATLAAGLSPFAPDLSHMLAVTGHTLPALPPYACHMLLILGHFLAAFASSRGMPLGIAMPAAAATALARLPGAILRVIFRAAVRGTVGSALLSLFIHRCGSLPARGYGLMHSHGSPTDYQPHQR
jgi:hypothetical protein